MSKSRPFTFQLIVISGFIIFLYIFFALTTSIYRDYKLESQIENFEAEIDELAELAHKKPKDVEYFASDQYKDRYAKENLNLLNPGEKLIIIPQGEQIVRRGPSASTKKRLTPDSVLNLSMRQQWWEYFFGQTLSVETSIDQLKQKETPLVLPEEGV